MYSKYKSSFFYKKKFNQSFKISKVSTSFKKKQLIEERTLPSNQ